MCQPEEKPTQAQHMSYPDSAPVKPWLIYTCLSSVVLNDECAMEQSLFDTEQLLLAILHHKDVIWLEECSTEALWSFDGIPVPLLMENCDNCGIWSLSSLCLPSKGIWSGKTLSAKKEKQMNKQTKQTKTSPNKQTGLGSVVGIQVAALYITSKSLLIVAIHEKWFWF